MVLEMKSLFPARRVVLNNNNSSYLECNLECNRPLPVNLSYLDLDIRLGLFLNLVYSSLHMNPQ